MNPLDRKLKTIFKTLLSGAAQGLKRGQANEDFRNLRRQIVDPGLKQILERLFGDFSILPTSRAKLDAAEAFKIILLLRERSFAESSAFLFFYWRDVISAQNLDDVLLVAPDAASLEVWRKVARVSAKEIESRLLSDPVSTYATAGADWLLLHAKSEETTPLLELFLGRKERPKTLPPWADALTLALKKDKRGFLLDTILRCPSVGGDRITALAEVVRLNRTLLKTTLDRLPGILSRKEAPFSIVEFIDQIFRRISDTDGDEREFNTATLARLGSGIVLSDWRIGQGDAVLALITTYSRLLRNITVDESLAAHTWIFENLLPHGEKTGVKLQVTLDGARDVALAFQKMGKGFEPIEVLKATARNLGLVPIGKKGDAVIYNPLQHEDLDSGLLPGDPAIVEDGGWTHGNDVVLRARVRRGKSHV